MRELELDGIHDDDEHVILVDSDGGRYTLQIDEALRAAVRRDRPALGAIRATAATPLRPRDIQAMLRQGRTAEEIAEIAKVSLEHVRRYEGPVLAEREYTAQRCRAFPVGRGDGPSLGEIVAERLAARRAGEDVRWDAWRRADGTWDLELAFTAGGRERSAHWVADLDRRSIVAEDDEARWLVDEDPAAPEPGAGRARLTAIKRSVYDIEADGSFEETAARTRPRPLAWRPRPEPSVEAEPAAGRTEDPSRERSRSEARRDHPASIDADELDALNARRGLRSVPSPAAVPVPDGDEEPVWESLDEPAAPADAPNPAAGSAPAAEDATSPDPADEEALAEHARELAGASQPVDDLESLQEPSGEDSEEPVADGEPDEASAADDAPAAERADPAPGENDTVELTPLPGFAEESSGPAEPEEAPVRKPARKKSGSKRSSIPSWDEIVFGSKHD
ncbi:septation protein SepH [Brachybacterium phenoliresistens]|uniref:DUF3071 domain-containing protein n=1 Tax=Brachybacterium phenoliresistens TaxID=396014 RepID=Z9JYK4_9MICO|nr:septation protein SepH [Brachybacterium phenoliresistens]EWS82877.1 hypothetical protein BF93_07605 [Brachybacterium phenoliresistens]